MVLLRIVGLLMRQSVSILLALLLGWIHKSLLLLLLLLLMLHLSMLILMLMLKLLLLMLTVLRIDCLLGSCLPMGLRRTSVGGGIIRIVC